MIIEFEKLEANAIVKAELCIIGIGAAGVTLARELAGASIDVVVIESGKLEVREEIEALNEGESTGLPFLGLRGGRRRGFGGTTAAWGGQCCELDESDFNSRSWIPSSGWPFGRTELEPYYRRAEHVFGVNGEDYDESVWRRFHIKPAHLDPTRLQTSFSVFSPRPRIGKVYRKQIARARNVRVIIGATATNIRTNENASRVTGVDIRDLGGRAAQVAAKTFVLCTGAIETARLLLASRDVEPDGLGNSRGLVGRYFQDHPTSFTASIVADDTRRIQELYGVLYRGRTWYWPKISLSADLQRSAGVLNGAACAMFRYESPAIEILREMVRTTRTGGRFRFSAADILTLMRGAGAVADAGVRRYLLGRSPNAQPARIDLSCTIEQAPNPESRVFLGKSVDALGMPRVVVNWKIGELELRTFRTLTEAVAKEFRRADLGTIIPKPWLADNDASTWELWDNYHQSGTTRMSASASSGVVDSNCQVHGIEGLFVAGGPTFPASGYANPVLTSAALTIRLADHLKNMHASKGSRTTPLLSTAE